MTCCNAVPEVLPYASDTGNDCHGLSSDPQPLRCMFPHKHFGDQIVCFKTNTWCVFSCRCPLLGTFYTASSKQNFGQIEQRCLVYQSNK